MKKQHIQEYREAGRYELVERPAYYFGLGRRRFLQLFSGGLAVALTIGRTGRLLADDLDNPELAPPDEVEAWIHIEEKGRVTVYTGKVEVGQNIRTSLTQAVAEELRVPFDSIRMIMGDTDRTPYDRGTFGSLTTPQMGPQLRKAAVAAREALLDLAAEKWQVDRQLLTAADGYIVNTKSKDKIAYGQLTKGKKILRTIGADETLTPPDQWQIAGTSVPKVNGRDFVTGQHKYTPDLRLPGMLVGKVLRPPAFGAKLKAIDADEAMAMPGVTVVRDGDFIGLTAPDEATATRALTALRAEWTATPQISRAGLFDHLKANRPAEAGWGHGSPKTAGSVEAGMAAAKITNQQTYNADYIAHVPLEPRAAMAEWKNGKLTVWTGTQRPFGVREELVRAFGLTDDKVRVIMPDTGSGYGGKHTGDAAIEAARLAKAAGNPVRVFWTRQEEFTWAYFRPAAHIEVKSGVAADGAFTAWEFHTYNPGGSGVEMYYETPNQHVEAHPSDSPLRQGSYRALGATVNHFAKETHIDELAHQLGMDPLAFRLKNLKDERMIAVLKAAADKFGWGNAEPAPGRGYGIACGKEKGGYIATCAEVAADAEAGIIRVIRVVAAFECGAIVNPDHLENQVQGAIIQGIGGALLESIDFADGRILNPYLADYRVPRFGDTPELEVVLLDRHDIPSAGGGETPIVAIAPAIGNAVFAATGERLRSMPMRF